MARSSTSSSESKQVALAAARRARTRYLLCMAALRIRAEIDRRLRSFNLTAIQYTILSILVERDDLSSAELARRLMVKPQTMNEIIKWLERNGLVTRSADPSHRRILRTRLTRKGFSLLTKGDERVDQLEDELLKALGATQMKALQELLRQLNAKLAKPGKR